MTLQVQSSWKISFHEICEIYTSRVYTCTYFFSYFRIVCYQRYDERWLLFKFWTICTRTSLLAYIYVHICLGILHSIYKYHSDDVTVYYAQVVYSVYTPGYATPLWHHRYSTYEHPQSRSWEVCCFDKPPPSKLPLTSTSGGIYIHGIDLINHGLYIT